MTHVGTVAVHAPDGQPTPHVTLFAPVRVYPVLHAKVRVCRYEATAVLEMLPFAGAARAGQEVRLQGETVVHTVLAWQVRTPPPQNPVLHVKVVFELGAPMRVLYVPFAGCVRRGHDEQTGAAALHDPVGQPAPHETLFDPVMLNPALQVKVRKSRNVPASVLLMLPFTGATSAGQVVNTQGDTAVHVPLLKHVLTPPPQ